MPKQWSTIAGSLVVDFDQLRQSSMPMNFLSNTQKSRIGLQAVHHCIASAFDIVGENEG